jgi:hypothetical protein
MLRSLTENLLLLSLFSPVLLLFLSLNLLTLSLSKLTLSLSLSFSPALPLPGRSAVLHRIPSLSLSLRHSLFPAGRPSLFTGFRLHRPASFSLSSVLHRRETLSLLSPANRSSSPARTFLHRQGSISLFFFNRRHNLLLPLFIYFYFFSLFLFF